MRFLLVLTSVLVLCAGGESVARDGGPKRAPLAPDVVARRMTVAYAKDADEFSQLATTRIPDRFAVVVELLETAGDRRPALLNAFADLLDAVPGQHGAAAAARTWAAADRDAVAAEVAALRHLRTVDPRANDLEPYEDRPAPGTHSIVGPLLAIRRGQTLVRLAQLDEAHDVARSMEEQGRERAWHRLVADAANVAALAHRAASRRDAAAAAHVRAARASERAGDTEREWYHLQTAIVLQLHLGRLAQRYVLGLRLQKLLEQTQRPRARLRSEMWLLDCECRFGALTRAERRATRMIEDAERIGAPEVTRNVQGWLVQIYTAQGRLQAALELADALRDDPELARFPHDRARIANAVARLYNDVGRTEDALALCRAVLESAPSERDYVMTALGGLAHTLASLLRNAGHHEEALAEYERAAALHRKHQQWSRLRHTLRALAAFHIDQGRLADAEKAVLEIEKISKDGVPRVRAEARVSRGRLAVASGDPETALRAFDAALRLHRELEPRPVSDAHVLAWRGRARLALSQHAAAHEDLKRASAMLVRVATGLGERQAMGLRDQTHGVASHGFVAALTEPLGNGALASAWWFREAGRALVLAGAIRNRNASALDRLSPKDRMAEEDALQALARAQMRHVSEPTVNRLEASRAFHAARKAYNVVANRIDRVVRGDGTERPRPLPLPEFQALLPEETTALAYMETASSIYGLCVRRDRVDAKRLGARDELHRLVSAWRDLASAPGGPATKTAAQLYDILVRPFEPLLAPSKNLIVLPDGPLAYLPFGALVTARGPDGAAQRYLLDRLAVEYVPSGAVYQALRRRTASRPAGVGLLAVGAPDYAGSTYPPLAGSRAEVDAVAALYPEDRRTVLTGTQASLRTWNLQLAKAGRAPLRCVHLACHGLVDPERPRLSGLVFAGGEVLSVEQLHRRQVPCDLVILSACETAGGTFRRGEGVIGLARGFFQSGAHGIVATTWPVADAPTAALMTALHAAWTKGASASEALRQARLAFRRSPGPRSHPYYWAPFVYWGP